MPPKDDPETAALKKELNDLIEKFKVNITFPGITLMFSLHTQKKERKIEVLL